MTRIKISGVTRPQDAELAVETGADIVACVFNSESPRYVTIGQALAIRRALPASVKFVGIFVDTPAPLMQRVADSCYLDWIQLFGREQRSELDEMRPYAFKGVVVQEAADLDHALPAYLGRWSKFDPAQPALLIHLTGTVGDQWSLIVRASSRAPIILAASSLSAASVATALHEASPWGVDVWDAVESAPGQLDAPRLREFVAAVRDADAAPRHGSEPTQRSRGRFRFGRGRHVDAVEPAESTESEEPGEGDQTT